MRLRLHGTREEVAEAIRRLLEVLEVVAVSQPYPDRGASVLVQVYLEVRIDPTGPPNPAPAGPARPARRSRKPQT
jgi:hypothetical protein